jgi:hypothetical protein
MAGEPNEPPERIPLVADIRCGKRPDNRQGKSSLKKSPDSLESGRQSPIAVITLRLLLREEKQGTTASRLSFRNQFSSAFAAP